MTLEERIQEDIKAALRGKEKTRLDTLRSLYAQVKDERIKLRPKRELTDEDVVRVIMSAVKKRKEAIELYRQGGRQDLVEKEQAELDVLQKYLPEQLSEQEVEKIVDEIIRQVGAASIKDLGKVMGPAMARLKGKADGKMVQSLVRERLTKLSS